MPYYCTTFGQQPGEKWTWSSSTDKKLGVCVPCYVQETDSNPNEFAGEWNEDEAMIEILSNGNDSSQTLFD